MISVCSELKPKMRGDSPPHGLRAILPAVQAHSDYEAKSDTALLFPTVALWIISVSLNPVLSSGLQHKLIEPKHPNSTTQVL